MNVRDMLASKMLRHKNLVSAHNTLRKDAQRDLIDATEPGDKWVTEDTFVKAVRVDPKPKRIVLWDKLLPDLSMKQRAAVMVEMPSEEALLAAVASGLIQAKVVDSYSEWSDMSPYILVSQVNEEYVLED